MRDSERAELQQSVVDQQAGVIEQYKQALEESHQVVDLLRAEVRRLEGCLDMPGNALLANLHASWVEVELAIEYRAADIDCEGDEYEPDGHTPLECIHCRERAKAEVDAFMAISASLEGMILTTRNILGIDDPKYIPVRPVKSNLDREIREEWVSDAWDSCMAMVPVGRFGPYEPEKYDAERDAYIPPVDQEAK